MPTLPDASRRAMAGPLPGLDAHLRMAPRFDDGPPPRVAAPDFRPAAVLLLLYPFDDSEVAIEPGGVEVLGRLTPLPIDVSRHLLHPIVALASRRPDFLVAEPEVERRSRSRSHGSRTRPLWNASGGNMPLGRT